jgi:hypothetical protein
MVRSSNEKILLRVVPRRGRGLFCPLQNRPAKFWNAKIAGKGIFWNEPPAFRMRSKEWRYHKERNASFRKK